MRAQKRPDVRVLQLSSRVVSAARRLLVRYRVKLCQSGYVHFLLSPSLPLSHSVIRSKTSKDQKIVDRRDQMTGK